MGCDGNRISLEEHRTERESVVESGAPGMPANGPAPAGRSTLDRVDDYETTCRRSTAGSPSNRLEKLAEHVEPAYRRQSTLADRLEARCANLMLAS